jgi:hypothetical protein
VGSGKTMLMDLFLKTLPHIPLQQSPAPPTPNPTSNSSSTGSSSTDGSSTAGRVVLPPGAPDELWTSSLCVEAERLHFHTFMLGVHQQLHQLQQALPKVVGRSRSGLPVYRCADTCVHVCTGHMRAFPPQEQCIAGCLKKLREVTWVDCEVRFTHVCTCVHRKCIARVVCYAKRASKH